MPPPFQSQRVWHLGCRVGRINEFPEILHHPLGERFRVRIILHHRKAALPDAALEPRQLRAMLRAFRCVIAAAAVCIGWAAKVEEGVSRHRRVVEHAMQHLEFGDALAAGVLRQPRLFLHERRIVLLHLRHPAVALAQQPDEVGARTVNLRQTDGQHLALLRFRLGDAPAQVHIHQFHLPLPATAAQFRKDAPDEDVPLAGEIPERRTDEEADGAGGRVHAVRFQPVVAGLRVEWPRLRMKSWR